MTPESLDYAITRYGVTMASWQEHAAGHTPYLPAFLAGWYCRAIGADKPERAAVGQFADSFWAGWREADSAVIVSNRDRPDLRGRSFFADRG